MAHIATPVITDSDFISLYYVDLDNNRYEIGQMDGLRQSVQAVAKKRVSFSEAMTLYIDCFVEDSYRDLLRKVSDRDFIINQLSIQNNYYVEYEVLPNDNGQRYFELHFIRSEAGEQNKCLLGWKCVDAKHDRMDEQARQEAQLKNAISESNYRKTLLKSLAGIYYSMHIIFVQENRFQEVGSVERVTDTLRGYITAQEGFRQTIDKLVVPEYQEEMTEFLDITTLDERLKNRVSITHEFYGTSNVWIRGMFIPAVRDKDGKLVEVLYVTRVIDEEKKKELEYQRILKNAYRNTDRIYRESIKMLLAGVVTIRESDLTILAINDALTGLLGIDANAEIPTNYFDLIQISLENEEEIRNQMLKRMANSESEIVYEVTLRRKDGEVRMALNQSKRIELSSGEKVIINTLTDITDRKKLENNLKMLSEMVLPRSIID